MDKRFILLLLALFPVLLASAQTPDSDLCNLDFEEDTTQVTSLNDIIAMQEVAYSRNYKNKFINNIWRKLHFFAISYANTTLTGKGIMVYDENTGQMVSKTVKYENDWGLALKTSRTIPLHKKAIADIVAFGWEFSGLDLSINHYAQDPSALYDSRLTATDDGKASHYVPWGLEMYNFAYGMQTGLSLSVAPFVNLRSEAAAHIRMQAYFTIGYRASILWMRGDDSRDMNKGEEFNRTLFEEVSNSNKFCWGHGLMKTWGIRLNWKKIAIGFEAVSGNYKYQPAEKQVFGAGKHKFSETSKRVSLSYVW